MQAALQHGHVELHHKRNIPYAILHAQHLELERLRSIDALSELRLHSIDTTLATLIDVQGGCERIKNTPFPRGYSFISERLLLAYGVLFPFSLVSDVGLWVVPINLIVCGAFALISEVGRVLEDPFDLFWNGLPLTALFMTIEVNLRQRLGDTDLPVIPSVDKNGVLM